MYAYQISKILVHRHFFFKWGYPPNLECKLYLEVDNYHVLTNVSFFGCATNNDNFHSSTPTYNIMEQSVQPRSPGEGVWSRPTGEEVWSHPAWAGVWSRPAREVVRLQLEIT